MTQEQFDIVVGMLNAEAGAVSDAKRPDYTIGNQDVLHNFKETARIAGITPLQAWLVHFYKHTSAVAKFVQRPYEPTSEPMHLRFVDLKNYIELGFALYKEWSDPIPVVQTPFEKQQPVTATSENWVKEKSPTYVDPDCYLPVHPDDVPTPTPNVQTVNPKEQHTQPVHFR